MVMVTVQIMELTSADSLRINAVQRSYSTVTECSMSRDSNLECVQAHPCSGVQRTRAGFGKLTQLHHKLEWVLF